MPKISLSLSIKHIECIRGKSPCIREGVHTIAIREVAVTTKIPRHLQEGIPQIFLDRREETTLPLRNHSSGTILDLHMNTVFSRFGFLSPVEIKRWLEDEAMIPIMHIIAHLSALEGFHRLRQIVDSRSLSFESVINEDIRSLGERHDTNKIYEVFNGSAFLTHIQDCIGDMIEQNPKDIWPFVHLFEEMQNQTSDGWRFLPRLSEKPQTGSHRSLQIMTCANSSRGSQNIQIELKDCNNFQSLKGSAKQVTLNLLR